MLAGCTALAAGYLSPWRPTKRVELRKFGHLARKIHRGATIKVNSAANIRLTDERRDKDKRRAFEEAELTSIFNSQLDRQRSGWRPQQRHLPGCQQFRDARQATAFEGNILAHTSITLNTGATILCSRAIALTGAFTIDTNTISNDCANGSHGFSGSGGSGGGAVPEPAT